MDSNKDINQNQNVVKRQIDDASILKGLYLITEYIEENDPLYNNIRLAGLDMCYKEGEVKVRAITKCITMIEVAHMSKKISDMNAKILIKALSSYREWVTSTIVVKNPEMAEVLIFDQESDIIQEDIKTNTEVVVPHIVTKTKDVELKSSGDVKVQLQEKSVTTQERSMSFTVPRDSSAAQAEIMDIGSRRKKIIEVVRSKGQITINELMETIKGCSSKTIQRELTSLVLSGTLKKTGERRWSQYSLK